MKKKYLIILIICLFIALLVAGFIMDKGLHKQPAAVKNEPVQTEEPKPSSTTYVSPIDFETLQKENSDIYAWLEIPGSDISYPVLQNSEDDKLYLTHGADKAYDENGALFSESVYNKRDFTEPVHIIYGHRMNSGKMFGNLQLMYTDDFEKYPEIVIYTPEEEIKYEVFAAVAFSNRHILYYYDCFKESIMMDEFIKDIYAVRNIGSYVDKEVEIKDTDQLLVLSTCLRGDRTSRYLVIAKRVE